MTSAASVNMTVADYWGRCARCGETLLEDDDYCPSCGKQRAYGDIVR